MREIYISWLIKQLAGSPNGFSRLTREDIGGRRYGDIFVLPGARRLRQLLPAPSTRF